MPLTTYRRKLIDAMFAANDGKCCYCSKPLRKNYYSDEHFSDDATVDHIVPKARGGTNDPANLALACRRCNGAKGDRSLAAFLADPRSEPERRKDRQQGVIRRRRNVRFVDVPPDGQPKAAKGTLASAIAAGAVTEHGTYLRPPREYDDPKKQAAFEGAYKGREYMLKPARDPIVRAVLDRFPGAEVVDVRIPSAPDPRPRGRKMSALETAKWLRESAERKGKPWPLA